MHDCLLDSCTFISMFYPKGSPIGVHIVKLYVQTLSLIMLLVLVMFSVFVLKLLYSVY